MDRTKKTYGFFKVLVKAGEALSSLPGPALGEKGKYDFL
jgi:hypothetical protein